MYTEKKPGIQPGGDSSGYTNLGTALVDPVTNNVTSAEEGSSVISLKKYLDLNESDLKKLLPPDPNELLVSALTDSYRATLTVMGSCGGQVSPALDFGLKESLFRVGERLLEKLTPSVVKEIEKGIEQRLQQWSEQTAGYMKQKTGEVKEILLVLTRTAESAAQRDQRYVHQFTVLTERFQTIANLEDLTKIRVSLVESAVQLKACTNKMAEDSRDSLAKLQAEVSSYQTKLEKVEWLATRDTLTKLENRRAVEAQMDRRIAQNQPFFVLMIDLDGFKQINDLHGHLAGDDLLKQFATELRSQSRSNDVIGRWGGDEFIVLMQGSLREAEAYIERVQRWVFGSYSVQVGAGACKVSMRASIGMAKWTPEETIQDVLGRADASMYAQKRASSVASANGNEHASFAGLGRPNI